MRTVLDTNVLISAVLLPRSLPRRAFDYACTNGKILASAPTVEELDTVLRRPKFDSYLAEAARLEFLAAFIREVELVEITTNITECRDPKDNKFLELAVSGHATAIISGDQDLLSLNPFRRIAILTPQEFLQKSKTT